MGAQCNGLKVYARNTEITLIAMYKDAIGSGSMDLVVNCNNLSNKLRTSLQMLPQNNIWIEVYCHVH